MKITITEDKGTVYGRFLCDDYVPFLEAWLAHRRRGLGILIATENQQNRQFHHPNVVRYDGANIQEVKHWLTRAFHRDSTMAL